MSKLASTPRLHHLLCLCVCTLTFIPTLRAQSPAASAQTTQVVAAANKFLATLTPGQRAKVVYAFTDNAQRARWSNFPTGFVPRGGINLKQMSAPQKTAALDLMKIVLSRSGYEKVSEIRLADNDFKNNGSKRGGGPRGGPPPNGGQPPNGAGGPPPGAGPGGPPNGGPPPNMSSDNMFGADLYYISILGTPSTTAPWMLQFGGHHLALNITIVGSQGIMTPSLTGAQPATFTLNGKTIRPLAHESDMAVALMQSLTPQQRAQAILSYRVADLVLGPGQDGKRIAPEGLKVSTMTAAQKSMLLELIAQWAGIMNDAMASTRMAQLKAELNDTWFAWSAPSTAKSDASDLKPGANITAYYRIQGPHLVIEYAPQSDEPTNHVHTIYRDPTNDYGQTSAK